MSTHDSQPPLRFTGHRNLSQRLVLATLTGRAVRISQIRPDSAAAPGLAPHEISLLRLLDALTNGSHIEFSYTGTTLLYRPGLITGSSAGYGADGQGVTRHVLPAANRRGASYFLVPVCLLAPFSKKPLNVLLTGPGCITSATSVATSARPRASSDPASATQTLDASADSVRTAILPLYAHFGITLNIELRIQRRSCAGAHGVGGAGEVQLLFGHQVRLPRTAHLQTPGRVKRVRGVAYATGVSGTNNARSIEAARGVLNQFGADVYIFSDVGGAPAAEDERGERGARERRKTGIGFGMALVAESATGSLYSADFVSPAAGGLPAEDVGRRCAWQLLERIEQGGCVDALGAPTVLTLMAMGSEDVGRLVLGKDVLARPDVVGLARDLKEFGGSAWGLKEPKGDAEHTVGVSVVGRGIGNVGKKIA